MTSNRIFLATAAFAVALAGFSASAKSFKRGVGENSFALQEEIDVLLPGVSWFYNWANTPNTNIYDLPNADFEFIPMCWNSSYNADNIRAYCQNHPETKYLLGFNEPNFTSQANMTPAAAAEAWPAVKALADELGLELVGPAVNYSPDGEENNPYTWYANFVSLVGLDSFDYIAIHNYSGGSDGMKEMIDQFYELYGKKIWVTEFCNWTGTVTAASQISSMVEQIEYLEKSDRVFRYAWFKAKGSITSSPCYGLIVPKNGYGERELSEQGLVYCYMSDFDETVYHPTGELIAATEYINSQNVTLGETNDGQNPTKIEVAQFNSGAYLDYQFDVPKAGSYTLTLRVSGVGEPTRFDPAISVQSVDADGNVLSTLAASQQFELSGDDTVYTEVSFSMTLEAGQQRIRLQDSRIYQPSGIRISALQLSDDSGVGEVEAGGSLTVCACGGDFMVSGPVARAVVSDLQGRVVYAGRPDGGVISVGGLAGGVYIVALTAESGGTKTFKVINK